MKTTFNLLFCILIFCQITVAQESPGVYAVQIDSVQTLLETTSKKDTIQVIHLNHLARLCIYNLQYERGLTSATEARELVKTIKYPQGEGLNFRTLHILHYDSWVFSEPYYVLTFWSFADLKKAEITINIKNPSV